ncbi:MAG: FkbM family methyltransferase [Nitratireductor sp.]
MSFLTSKLSTVTRKFPWLVDLLRKILPLSLKRKIGAALLPSNPTGVVKANDGREFVSIPDRLFLQVVYDGIFEPSLSNFINNTISKGDVSVDVGSNFGWFATLMAQKCDKVICYEPGNRIEKIFRQNVKLNKQEEIVEIRKLAVGAEEGSAQFVIEGDEARESALGYVGAATSPDETNNTETVNIVRLDKDLEKYKNKISLIKMDAEGFEHYAFKGALDLLSCDNPPVIITEANRETLERSGTTREALCKELLDLNYTLYGMTAKGELYKDDRKAPALAGVPARGKFKSRIKV